MTTNGKTDGETENPPGTDEETDPRISGTDPHGTTGELEQPKRADLALKDADVTYRTLQQFHGGPTVPTRYNDSPTGVDDMLAAVMIGKELGIGPMQAINDLYIVNGQISMSGKLMSGLVHRAGHAIHVEVTNTKATATAFRRDPFTHKLVEMGEVTFTAEDAKRAGLDDKSTYKNYPRIMLSWRAISNLCRIYFADVLTLAAYVPEELDAADPIEALPGEVGLVVEGEIIEEQATAVVVEELDAEVVLEVPPKAKKKAKK